MADFYQKLVDELKLWAERAKANNTSVHIQLTFHLSPQGSVSIHDRQVDEFSQTGAYLGKPENEFRYEPIQEESVKLGRAFGEHLAKMIEVEDKQANSEGLDGNPLQIVYNQGPPKRDK